MDDAGLSEIGLSTDEAAAPDGRHHAIDFRLSVPWFGQRYFVTLVVGPERRRATRRTSERVLHPLSTTGNIVFMSAICAVVLSVTTVVVAVYSALFAG
jgi:hypothetical protein